ncbi:MAG: hypothetical protein AAF614_01105 [Chloroflexota bacterium]
MNVITNLNAFVVANEALTVTIVAVALVLLQIAIIVYAATRPSNEEDVDTASTYVMTNEEMDVYSAYGFMPWMF